MPLSMLFEFLRARVALLREDAETDGERGSDIVTTVIIISLFAAAAIVIVGILIAKATTAAHHVQTQ